MISKILAWLFAFFYTPVPNKVIQPPEVETMSEPLVDEVAAPVVAPVVEAAPAAVVSVTVTPAVADEVKAGVADFEAAFSFVESGIAQLGEAAKDELKELAKKYL
ncbi:hypothetical protein J1782_25130 [Rahnella sp. BCC 1045]|uniref:hypothetical protein n=1 Tax=Rahnella sp. BCC 1045 TaxID=2816251 RepID=UPI001C26646E|nr:hypothetical protein [Rahnella sp. BCC 1045]MBU9823178.1 hypothetical protein [Rahnella sp. BCC 1045]